MANENAPYVAKPGIPSGGVVVGTACRDVPCDSESMIRAELAALQREYTERAAPLLKTLSAIEALKPPKPIWIDSKTGKVIW